MGDIQFAKKIVNSPFKGFASNQMAYAFYCRFRQKVKLPFFSAPSLWCTIGTAHNYAPCTLYLVFFLHPSIFLNPPNLAFSPLPSGALLLLPSLLPQHGLTSPPAPRPLPRHGAPFRPCVWGAVCRKRVLSDMLCKTIVWLILS